MEPKILYEDKDIIAIEKPAGLVVHASAVSQKGRAPKGKGIKTGKKKRTDVPPEPTLVDWLLKKYPEIATVGDEPKMRPGIVHRLDKETSGVMLVARNQESFDYLKSLFKNREIKKIYAAIVWGIPDQQEGVIETPIGIKNGTLKRSVHSEKMQKDAKTEYTVLKNFKKPIAEKKQRDSLNKKENLQQENFSLVEVRPKTGRTHQIRVHFASIGHPIAGDHVYGSKKKRSISLGENDFPSRLMLHAHSITFVNKSGKLKTVTSPSPFKIH